MNAFTTLCPHDLQWCVARLPKALVTAMKLHGKNIIIAGGYIRACIAQEKVNDIDLFTPSKDIGETIALSLKKPRERLIKTDNALTLLGYKVPLQFIHRWTYAEPEDVVPSFDFTIARAAFWYDAVKGWQSCIDPAFYQDLAGKRLVYCSPDRNEDAGGSMLRVLKFYQRGYRIPLGSLSAVIARLLRGVDKNSSLFWNGENACGDVPDQAEVDAFRSKILCGLLREVDPAIDPDHIAHLPDEKKEVDLEKKEEAA